MGYSETQKGYKLYDLTTKSFFVSRDVQFLEHIFPFQNGNPSAEFMAEDEFLIPGNKVFPLNDQYLDSAQLADMSPYIVVSDHVIDPLIDSHITTIVVLATMVPFVEISHDVIPECTFTSEHANDDAAVSTRRTSDKHIKPHIWQKDFVTANRGRFAHSYLYAIANIINYSGFSSTYQSYVAQFSTDIEPTLYHQEIQDPRWIQAMKDEIQALEYNGTRADGQVEGFKARLVAKGFNKREGLDYQKTFSPVVKMVTVRTVISLDVWSIQQMDVYNAFLQDDLNEEVYMQLPQGIKNGTQDLKVCRLLKSLYGLKQASRQWNVKLTSALVTTDSGLSGSKTIATPVELNKKLTACEFDNHIDGPLDPVLADPGKYQRLVGRLLYLTITTPDIAFAVQSLSQRSITGYMIKFGESLISWKFKKQPTIFKSSAEAEYKSLASDVAEIVWLFGLFKELNVKLHLQVSLHYDSKADF
ncbi:uncharacterized protein LOC125842954 [Solanum stenotomum]|uniref:uncharacterized protein LOC125842954 n=1 Tax=Solanum stenotomum TaxID=172797 RepID=UPI0020D09D28|nr:uncharacterized protein LOC125842954 [Solanum stenotomum]